jgi:tight adherence protein B
MMTVICLLFAALAVWLGMLPPRAEQPAVASGAPALRVGRRGVSPVSVVGGPASAATVAVATVLDGARGAVLGLALLVVAWTAASLLRQRHRAGLERRRRTEVAQACAALAAQLRIGQAPGVALTAAARDHPVLREARDAQDLGGEVVRVWRTQAQLAGYGGLLDLARAWQVSGRTGAPMAATLEQVAAALVAEQALHAVVVGELSAPRATGKVMAVLPGCGVGLGYLLGGEPIGWLLGGPLGWACLLAGVVLACLGVLWIEALARRAAN